MIIWLIIYLECMQVGTVTLKCGPVWVKLIAQTFYFQLAWGQVIKQRGELSVIQWTTANHTYI